MPLWWRIFAGESASYADYDRCVAEVAWLAMESREPELTTAVDLCLPDGKLNPAAVGWSRRPLHRSNLRGWGRVKRWEYWGIVTPMYIIGLVVSSLDYAGVHSVFVLDREGGREVVNADTVVPLGRGTEFSQHSGAGLARGRGGGIDIAIDQRPEGTAITAAAPECDMELFVAAPAERESLGVVIPWSSRRFQYTVKDVGRPVRGWVRVAGERSTVNDADSFAVLDHGRGKWPYRMTWNWAAGAAMDGRAVQLAGKWTNGTGLTENALFLAGRMHKISVELHWEYDRRDWTRPWRIRGERLDATFHPFYEKVSRTSLGVVAGETHQCFGTFTGQALTDDDQPVPLEGLTGWAEEAHNRW